MSQNVYTLSVHLYRIDNEAFCLRMKVRVLVEIYVLKLVNVEQKRG